MDDRGFGLSPGRAETEERCHVQLSDHNVDILVRA